MYRTTNMFEKEKKRRKKKADTKEQRSFDIRFFSPLLGGMLCSTVRTSCCCKSAPSSSFPFLLLYICCTPHSTCFFFLFYNPHIELRQLHAPPSLIDVSFFTLLSKCLPCKSCNGRSHRSRRKDASAVHVARKKKKACQSHRLP